MRGLIPVKQVPLGPLVRSARTSSGPLFLPAAFSRTASTSASEEDFDKARHWYAQLSSSPLPREIGEVSYSRSSGPGGQNVNK